MRDDLEQEAVACAKGPLDVQLKISIEGPQGTVSAVDVIPESSDEDPEVLSCIEDLVAAREFGPTGTTVRRGAKFPLHIDGPSAQR